MEDITENFFSFDSWEDISFQNKTTDKLIEWKELSDYEKTLFCLIMAKRTTFHLAKIDVFWQNELQKFDKPDFRLISKAGAEGKQKAALKEDVVLYLAKLTKLRKKFATIYEEFAIESFKKYAEEIPEFEKGKILQDIREYHDKHNLVERK